jgi:hypothetical protein
MEPFTTSKMKVRKLTKQDEEKIFIMVIDLFHSDFPYPRNEAYGAPGMIFNKGFQGTNISIHWMELSWKLLKKISEILELGPAVISLYATVCYEEKENPIDFIYDLYKQI